MARELNVSIGSGTLPHIGPILPSISGQFPEGTYPVPNVRDDLKTLLGSAVVVVNPEDFSVHIGLQQRRVTVSTTAQALPGTPLENRRAIVIHNNGPNVLYIGRAGVLTTDGLPLADGEKIAIDIQGHGGMTIYGISTGTTDVRILELA